ncbi:p53-like transcription factor [Trichoderma aethiopicum]
MLVVAIGCSNCNMRGIYCNGTSTNTWPCKACREARFHCEPPGGSVEPDSLSLFTQSFYHPPEPPMRESSPFLGVTAHGTLFNARSLVQKDVQLYASIKSDISLANGEWLCYQPNYFSCTCSYSLSPIEFADNIKLKPESSSRSYNTIGFAMSISAIERDYEFHESCVEIVQRGSHGVYGPSARAPAKVQLPPRELPLTDARTKRSSHRVLPREHTFDQLEVKTVTARNGRQPGGRLYFQLVVELWADLGSYHPARFIKVASMKSFTMTLRGQHQRPIHVLPTPDQSQEADRAGRVTISFDGKYSSNSASIFESDLNPEEDDPVDSFSAIATEADILQAPVLRSSVMKKYVGRASTDGSNAPYSDDELQASIRAMLPSSDECDEWPPTSLDDHVNTMQVPDRTLQAPDRTMRGLQRRSPQLRILSWFKNISRPRLKPGFRRIEWTCDCGVDLYGDFSQEEPSDLDALEASLQSHAPNASPASDSSNAEVVEETPRNSQRSNSSLWDAGTAASPALTDASSVDLNSKFLALCVNAGGMYKKLAELDTSHIKSDSEAFSELKRLYFEHRGLRSRLSLLIKPVTVEFVRFTLWNLRHGYVSITDRPESMPPKTAIDYDFVPEPMPPEVFIHYLEHGDGDLSPNRCTWLPRLPQRLNGKVLHCGEAAEGWGIHVVEGPRGAAVFWIVMAVILAGVLAVVLWASLMGDIQGATGLGALIVALPSAVMAAFLLRLEAI